MKILPTYRIRINDSYYVTTPRDYAYLLLQAALALLVASWAFSFW